MDRWLSACFQTVPSFGTRAKEEEWVFKWVYLLHARVSTLQAIYCDSLRRKKLWFNEALGTSVEGKKSKENFLLAPSERKRGKTSSFFFSAEPISARLKSCVCLGRLLNQINPLPNRNLVNEFEAIILQAPGLSRIESEIKSYRDHKRTAHLSFLRSAGAFILLMMLSNRILKCEMRFKGRWILTATHMPQNRNMPKVNSYCRRTNEALLTIRGLTTVLRSRSNNSWPSAV